MLTEIVPFKTQEEGVYLRGPKAVPQPGEMLTPGWGAQLAQGRGEPRLYPVESTGLLEDYPNATDRPTSFHRTAESVRVVRVVRQLRGWPRHSPASVQAMWEVFPVPR